MLIGGLVLLLSILNVLIWVWDSVWPSNNEANLKYEIMIIKKDYNL